MDLNNFTIKAQEAIQKPLKLPQPNRTNLIDPSHMLKGILVVDENVVPYLLRKLNVNFESFSTSLDRIIDSLPKVSGGQQYFSI